MANTPVSGGKPKEAQQKRARLQRAIMQQAPAITSIFSQFDSDGKGTVSREEFDLGMSALGFSPTDRSFKRMVQSCAANDRVDYNRFLTGMRERQASPSVGTGRVGKTPSAAGTFRKYDTSGDGTVTPYQLALGLAELNVGLSPKAIADIVAKRAVVSPSAKSRTETESVDYQSVLDDLGISVASPTKRERERERESNRVHAASVGPKASPPVSPTLDEAGEASPPRPDSAGSTGYSAGDDMYEEYDADMYSSQARVTTLPVCDGSAAIEGETGRVTVLERSSGSVVSTVQTREGEGAIVVTPIPTETPRRRVIEARESREKTDIVTGVSRATPAPSRSAFLSAFGHASTLVDTHVYGDMAQLRQALSQEDVDMGDIAGALTAATGAPLTESDRWALRTAYSAQRPGKDRDSQVDACLRVLKAGIKVAHAEPEPVASLKHVKSSATLAQRSNRPISSQMAAKNPGQSAAMKALGVDAARRVLEVRRETYAKDGAEDKGKESDADLCRAALEVGGALSALPGMSDICTDLQARGQTVRVAEVAQALSAVSTMPKEQLETAIQETCPVEDGRVAVNTVFAAMHDALETVAHSKPLRKHPLLNVDTERESSVSGTPRVGEVSGTMQRLASLQQSLKQAVGHNPDRLHQVFSRTDENGDGQLTREEFTSAVHKELGDSLNQEELNEMFTLVAEGGPTIDFIDFHKVFRFKDDRDQQDMQKQAGKGRGVYAGAQQETEIEVENPEEIPLPPSPPPALQKGVTEDQQTRVLRGLRGKILDRVDVSDLSSLVAQFAEKDEEGGLSVASLHRLLKYADLETTPLELTSLSQCLSLDAGQDRTSEAEVVAMLTPKPAPYIPVPSRVMQEVSALQSSMDAQTMQRHQRQQLQNLVDSIHDRMITCRPDGELQTVFNVFDHDGDGILMPAEFRDGLRSIGVDLGEHELALLLAAVDKNRTGTVQFSEFEALARAPIKTGKELATELQDRRGIKNYEVAVSADNPVTAPSETPVPLPTPMEKHLNDIRERLAMKIDSKYGGRISQVFLKFDHTREGSMDYIQFRKALSHVGLALGQEDLDLVITSLDRNGDGKVSLPELQSWVNPQVTSEDKQESRLRLRASQSIENQDPTDSLETIKDGVLNRMSFSHSSAADLFAKFDHNNDGTLSLGELGHGLASVGVQLSDHDQSILHAHLLQGSEGGVTLEAFEEFVKPDSAKDIYSGLTRHTLKQGRDHVPQVTFSLTDKGEAPQGSAPDTPRAQREAAADVLLQNSVTHSKEGALGMGHTLLRQMRKVDIDGDGQITSYELLRTLNDNGISASKGDMEAIARECPGKVEGLVSVEAVEQLVRDRAGSLPSHPAPASPLSVLPAPQTPQAKSRRRRARQCLSVPISHCPSPIVYSEGKQHLEEAERETVPAVPVSEPVSRPVSRTYQSEPFRSDSNHPRSRNGVVPASSCHFDGSCPIAKAGSEMDLVTAADEPLSSSHSGAIGRDNKREKVSVATARARRDAQASARVSAAASLSRDDQLCMQRAVNAVNRRHGRNSTTAALRDALAVEGGRATLSHNDVRRALKRAHIDLPPTTVSHMLKALDPRKQGIISTVDVPALVQDVMQGTAVDSRRGAKGAERSRIGRASAPKPSREREREEAPRPVSRHTSSNTSAGLGAALSWESPEGGAPAERPVRAASSPRNRLASSSSHDRIFVERPVHRRVVKGGHQSPSMIANGTGIQPEATRCKRLGAVTSPRMDHIEFQYSRQSRPGQAQRAMSVPRSPTFHRSDQLEEWAR
ncbi:hypothetical protein KIPB_007041 [Kipferlia bialata]|uniref:EF-hand domain-containing protein n=1 Tax=Kipferlia bialata TaxID=797122 RepID=A0A9K3CXZ8_9EUKA|nr:hypothetical protein KIPB_003336 [Kipferlia bialata]GIQ82719.1 hypothetical protein KIPB_003907 [Kipferlia bialata]GIQ82918.1 hypothetical protein KIPB_004145 [Kipferlia bialata]GIQ85389.1 hypothetical protein KIPB_007041 [Kipferlia bialata]|eukprot:g3336.t1